jgi:hypothetical protein
MQLLNFMFSGFWTFIGCCILIDVTIVNIFKSINYYFKMRCVTKLSNDGKSAEEIEMLFGKKENSNKQENKIK